MGLRLVLPLPHATYRLGAAAAKSQARLQGGLATLPTHIWFGLLDAMLLTRLFIWKLSVGYIVCRFQTWRNQVRNQIDFVGSLTYFNNSPEFLFFGTKPGTKLILWRTVCKTPCLPLADMAESSGTKPGTKLILWEALRISVISRNAAFWNQGGTKPGTK